MELAHPLTHALPLSALLTLAREQYTALKFKKKKKRKRKKKMKKNVLCVSLYLLNVKFSSWVRLLRKS